MPRKKKQCTWIADYAEYIEDRGKRQLRILLREVGPSWFVELASFQKEILGYLSSNIKKDLLEERPIRTRKALHDLGVTYRIKNKVLLKAMSTCIDDPGVFIWNLYSAIYKQSPSELRGEYDMSAMLLMSALVFIDLKECIECLEKLTTVTKKRNAIPETNKKTRYYEPAVKFGAYLQKMYVPLYSNYPSCHPKPRPPPLDCKIRIRSPELDLRLERNRKHNAFVRVCNYKFWKPPGDQRNPLLLLKAKARHIGPYEHVQCCVGPVAFIGSRARYLLNSVCYLPTRYIPINGGLILLSSGELVLLVAGYWVAERETKSGCESTCSCENKWETLIMNYVRDQKCTCRHLYDYGWPGKAPETYFYPPTRHRPYYLDKAKIYQEDPMEDFIKRTVEDAVQSGETTPTPSLPSVKAAGLKESELLAAFLADLSNTPLIIPHLPQANLLNNLQEWVRRRVKGKIEPEFHKQLLARSMRRWLWLKRMDFKMRAYRIPFTQKQLHHLNWTHRPLIDKLFKALLNNFVTRNRMRQLEQTRLWWSSMKYDMYPVPSAFRDVYFTYMPANMMATHLVNPLNSEMIPKFGAKTCPLNIFLSPPLS